MRLRGRHEWRSSSPTAYSLLRLPGSYFFVRRSYTGTACTRSASSPGATARTRRPSCRRRLLLPLRASQRCTETASLIRLVCSRRGARGALAAGCGSAEMCQRLVRRQWPHANRAGWSMSRYPLRGSGDQRRDEHAITDRAGPQSFARRVAIHGRSVLLADQQYKQLFPYSL